VSDLLLVELRFAGVIEVLGGLAEFLAREVVEGVVHDDVTGAKSVAVGRLRRGMLAMIGLATLLFRSAR
jgi:hypothetical protein